MWLVLPVDFSACADNSLWGCSRGRFSVALPSSPHFPRLCPEVPASHGSSSLRPPPPTPEAIITREWPIWHPSLVVSPKFLERGCHEMEPEMVQKVLDFGCFWVPPKSLLFAGRFFPESDPPDFVVRKSAKSCIFAKSPVFWPLRTPIFPGLPEQGVTAIALEIGSKKAQFGSN